MSVDLRTQVDSERPQLSAGEFFGQTLPLLLDENQPLPQGRGERLVVEGEEPTDVDQAVLLGRDRRAVGEIEHLACDLAGRPAVLAGLPLSAAGAPDS